MPHYGPDDPLWVVVDATPESTLPDVLFQASIRDLLNQFHGGLTLKERPTLFTEKAEARAEALRRLMATRASVAIAKAAGQASGSPHRVAVLDADGKALCDVPIESE